MDNNIAEAEDRLQSLNLDESLKKAYDARAKEISDEVTRMRGAEETGREAGRKAGLEAGKKEGKKEERKKIIKTMKEKGLDDKEIEEITGFDPQDYL
ncbi:hypothetical protein ACUL41_05185 [Virgibacillus natechei]|uniref:hypothetical protein n=1 Tax=Virgibacillus sp. CBA3643 TaxID=2942278 RepID=UPI0035A3C592